MGRGISSASARADGVGTSELTVNFAGSSKPAIYPNVPSDLADAVVADPSLYNSSIRGQKFNGPAFSGIANQIGSIDFIEAAIDIIEIL